MSIAQVVQLPAHTLQVPLQGEHFICQLAPLGNLVGHGAGCLCDGIHLHVCQPMSMVGLCWGHAGSVV
eukprot:1048255-Prorocentrum_lima.AAC.1